MGASDHSDEDIIDEMKDAIKKASMDISKEVHKSALIYMMKQGWVRDEKHAEMEDFFVEKIPKVLTAKLSKNISTVLGLNLDM